MKVIDLLNKIANGEEVPKRIHIRDLDTYTWQEDVKAYWSDIDENDLLSDLDLSTTDLKEDIEIIEEEHKIPEKLETYKEVDNEDYFANILKISKNGEYEIDEATSVIVDKINEIIDYLEENK